MVALNYYDNKVVLVVGASDGLGLSIVTLLTRFSSARIIATSRSLIKIEERLSKLNGKNAKGVGLNLESSDEEISEVVRKIIAAESRLDVLINCAGMGFRGKVADTRMSVHRRVFQVDYFGQIAVIKSVMNHNASSPLHIVQVSSVQGYFGVGERAPYSAAKHALVGFIDSLRTECDPYPTNESGGSNTIVTLVSPGYINTNHSASAVTGSGTVYSKSDESTLNGYSPEFVAQQLLLKSAAKHREIIIADAKITFLVKLRYLCANLCFRILRNRQIGKKESLWKTIFKWIFST